jgi:tetratricopeptide (TPR) repeat protein
MPLKPEEVATGLAEVAPPAVVAVGEPEMSPEEPPAESGAVDPVPETAMRASRPSKPSTKRPRQRVEPSPPPVVQPDYDAELARIDDAAALTARGETLTNKGDLPTAARFFRRALEIDPDYAPALVAVGHGLLRAEKYDDAMQNATRALELARGVDARPGLEAEALYQMGRVYHQRGQEEAARRLLRQSTTLPRTPAETWFYLGESLASENSPAARNAYERYLELRPNGHLADRARRAIQ